MLLSNENSTILGRNANNGMNASTFYWNLNNDSGNLNRNIGRQLAGSTVVNVLPQLSCVHTQIGCPKAQSSESEMRGAHQQ